MSIEMDWEFLGPDNAKAEIRAAVGYLLEPPVVEDEQIDTAEPAQ
jgi:hypothetical protein